VGKNHHFGEGGGTKKNHASGGGGKKKRLTRGQKGAWRMKIALVKKKNEGQKKVEDGPNEETPFFSCVGFGKHKYQRRGQKKRKK